MAGTPLFLAALIAWAEDVPGELPPIAPIKEEAEAPCGPEPAEPAAPADDGEPAPKAPKAKATPRPPCPGAHVPGQAPRAERARPPAAAAPAVPPPVAEERRARRTQAGRAAQRDAQALLATLNQGAPDGALVGGPPGAALPAAAAPPGAALPPAAQSRFGNTLQTVAPPAAAPDKPAAPQTPWYKSAWEGTKGFVDRWTPSPMKLADDVYFEASRRFPDSSSHNTEQDAWRHARWHQRMVDSMCPETGRSVCAPVAAAVAWAAGAVHEGMGLLSGQPAAEAKMDMSNNWKGLAAGLQGGDPRLIDQALASGQLVILEPSPAFQPLARK